MSKPSEEFRASFDSKYPAAFLEKYHVIECLSSTEQGETLLVGEEGTQSYYIAKATSSGGESAEAALLRSLSHPALPRVHDSFADGKTHILVREFIKGTPLDKAMQDRPFTQHETVDIGVQLCDVLSYLHAQTPPVIHRDVKPGNVILGSGGKVTLIDFGIARTYKADARKDTVFSGTNDFAPPEQYGFSQTDARADIFSLGMLLKYLLTRGELDGQIQDRRLARVVSRCTAFAPRQRYASAAAVKRALLMAGGRAGRGAATAAIAAASLLCGLLLGRYLTPYAPAAQENIVFAEPIVEKAARLMLDKPYGALERGELAAVTELYIVADGAVGDKDAFYAAYNEWNTHGHSSEASVSTLSDMALFPNLTTLCIVSGEYTNLSSLESCRAMTHVELYNNYKLTDISALVSLHELNYVGAIACPNVEDVTPLVGLPKLKNLDLSGRDQAFDAAPVARMGDFDLLLLKGVEDAHRYLGNKNICHLRLSETNIETMEPLQAVTGMDVLELAGSAMCDLAGIEKHTLLRKVDISHTAVTDLTPLRELPDLTELILSDDMDVDVSVLADMPGLTIVYQ